MNVHDIYRHISPWFRRRRLAHFHALLRPTEQTTILDVGGQLWCWPEEASPALVTMINVSYLPGSVSTARRRVIRGDGCALPFRDRSFDIGFSNSVIEHLGTWDNQRRFAAEIRRVGQRVWVQTPARWFFVEVHMITPFIHYLPKAWQRRLLRRFTVWGWLMRPTQAQVDAFLAEARLLTHREMRELFPDCRIERERFLLAFTKSYVAVRDEAGVSDPQPAAATRGAGTHPEEA